MLILITIRAALVLITLHAVLLLITLRVALVLITLHAMLLLITHMWPWF